MDFTYNLKSDIKDDVIFKIATHGSSEYEAAYNLREEILRKPLGLEFSPQEMEDDKGYIHIVGCMNIKTVATAVLVPTGKETKMQRVAILSEFQKLGIGSKMMKFCESQVKLLGFDGIYLHARHSVISFYLNNGYNCEGDYFEEVGIPHIKMRKNLGVNTN